MKLSLGDLVAITAGKDKGKQGKILRVLPAANRVIVAGVNMVTKHVKKTAQSEGRKMVYEASIHASNVMMVDPKTGKPTRVGYRKDGKGHKERFAKKSGVVIGRTKIEAAAKPKDAPKKKEKEGEAETTGGKKSPFWKKIGFGADAVAGNDAATPKAAEGGTTAAPTHRSGTRGS
ncbi:MAG: 50S ribosomal protein L24 [Candidatus Peribacteraceae bacterium]|nr:50S ribosomal protein L24 [Candidatus Peribacteraceae bacterium]